MKKIFFGLIATIAFSNITSGQAIFEHSYSTGRTNDEFDFGVYTSGITHAFFTQSGIHYYTLDNTTNIMSIFDSNHQPLQTISLPQTPLKIICLTDHLFNNDDSIEILYGAESNVLLINDQGTIIQTFDKYYAKIFKSDVDTYKLSISKPVSGNNNNIEFDIYSLPGTLSVLQQQIYLKDSFIGYPNPAESFINITNTLSKGETGVIEIFDSKGKKIMEKSIIGDNKFINLDVSNLSIGVYIYKLNGQTNRFIKE